MPNNTRMLHSMAIGVACLALVAVYIPRSNQQVPTEVSSEELALVQTFHHVTERSRTSEKVSTVAAVAHASNTSIPEAESELAGYHPEKILGIQPCREGYQTVWQQTTSEFLRMLTLAPAKEPCIPAGFYSETTSPMLAMVAQKVGFKRSRLALIAPLGYIAIAGILIFRTLWVIFFPDMKEVSRRAAAAQTSEKRPESEAWEQGLISWLTISWATDWVARWGNVEDSSMTRIKADELEGLGCEEDEPKHTDKKLQALWEEEIKRKGVKEANLFATMVRFITLRRLIKLVAWNTAYEVSMYLGPPLAMQWSISYAQTLYTLRLQGHEIPNELLVVPTIMIIITFTGLPLLMAIANTVSSFMAQHLTLQACGALSSMVVRKAQALPIPIEVSRKDLEKAKRDKYKKRGGPKTDEEELEFSDDENADQDKGIEDVVYDQNKQWKPPDNFSLVQVVANDINVNFVALPLQLCRCVVVLPVCIVLFILVFIKIRLTILVVMAIAICFSMLLMMAGFFQMKYLMAFFHLSGGRLHMLENTFYNIRTVKAFGWERLMLHKVHKHRSEELSALEGFYWRLGVFYQITYCVPKSLILMSVWGHHWMYPSESTINIFATLPLLFTAQNAILSVLETLPNIINAKPSVMRCENYLKQLDGPMGQPKCMAVPRHISVWPERLDPPPGMARKEGSLSDRGSLSERSSEGSLRIQGSFSWLLDGPAALEDLDLHLGSGECMAVLGAVGSGKSTLAMAILGEMYPIGDSRLEVPGKIAYSAQVPMVCEGTLRENVLFGEDLEPERYKTAIFSACLLPEVAVLPGGEQVPIGSRGISLSGGQRARVSMARASYNSKPGGLVLIDDPFGAVDARTARHLLNNYIHGSGLRGRTRVVITQPDPERINRFDKVAIISGGRVVLQGKTSEVMESKEYLDLLNTHQRQDLDEAGVRSLAYESTPRANQLTPRGLNSSDAFVLREEEFQGRVDGQTLNYFLGAGFHRRIMLCIFFYFIMQVTFLMMNVSLQHWSSNQVEYKAGLLAALPNPALYLKGYMFWWLAGTFAWGFCWHQGVTFTLAMSTLGFVDIMKRIMHAPVDMFFDKTPVGRIMNRMSADLMNLDNNTFNQITVLMALGFQIVVPMGYIHILMPIYFTALTIPFYCLVFALFRRYWRTMVPMRYLTHCSKSHTDDLLTEVAHSNVSVRAMQKQDFRMDQFQSLLSNQIKADVTTTLVLQRWLCNRLFLLSGFFITVMVLMAFWIPNVISFGGVGLCLCNCFQIVTSIEIYITAAAQAQFQFIVMNRLYEYTALPQEKAYHCEVDKKYTNMAVDLYRSNLGKLVSRKDEDGWKVIRQVKGQPDFVLLQETPSGKGSGMMGANGQTLEPLYPPDEQLQSTFPWHRITVCGDARMEAEGITQVLCGEKGRFEAAEWEHFKIEVQSSWLVDGVEVIIEDLRTGYGDIQRDILMDINLVIESRSKTAIVGTTGCGKSTMLLSLLRIIEPRDGRIYFNGVDISTLGLFLVRNSVGLVPQDPVLMQAPLRENIDPYNMYNDKELWYGLKLVQLDKWVESLEYGLHTPLAHDGGNMSFGQRQLLCLARAVIRQPPVLLLDEATSALDPATQELVNTTIQSYFPKTTIVVIAHRLETILNFDMIVVMERGRIVEKGSVKELSDVKGGNFAKMLACKRTW